MGLLVVRHAADEGLSLFQAPLRERQIHWDYTVAGVPTDPALLTPETTGLIVLGGVMSANDCTPDILSELYLIERALQMEIPLLGVCLGAQMIAKVLGARVHRAAVPELGWGEVHSTPAASHDPLLRHFSVTETVLQWHYETFDIPPGSIHLAASEVCPNQAFRFGRRTWGMQFHLEASPQLIEQWLAADALCGDTREIRHPVDPWNNSARLEQLAGAVIRSWLDATTR